MKCASVSFVIFISLVNCACAKAPSEASAKTQAKTKTSKACEASAIRADSDLAAAKQKVADDRCRASYATAKVALVNGSLAEWFASPGERCICRRSGIACAATGATCDHHQLCCGMHCDAGHCR